MIVWLLKSGWIVNGVGIDLDIVVVFVKVYIFVLNKLYLKDDKVNL